MVIEGCIPGPGNRMWVWKKEREGPGLALADNVQRMVSSRELVSWLLMEMLERPRLVCKPQVDFPQRVGISKAQSWKSLRSQVLTAFCVEDWVGENCEGGPLCRTHFPSGHIVREPVFICVGEVQATSCRTRLPWEWKTWHQGIPLSHSSRELKSRRHPWALARWEMQCWALSETADGPCQRVHSLTNGCRYLHKQYPMCVNCRDVSKSHGSHRSEGWRVGMAGEGLLEEVVL